MQPATYCSLPSRRPERHPWPNVALQPMCGRTRLRGGRLRAGHIRLNLWLQEPPTSSDLMLRSISPLYVAAVIFAAGCTAESEPKESAPAPDPVERRVEPIRQQATEADSLMRLREREVEALSRPDS